MSRTINSLFLLIGITLSTLAVGAEKAKEVLTNSVERVLVDYTRDPDFVQRYSDAAVEIAKRKINQITKGGRPPRLATGGAFGGYFLWDSAFCVLWARHLASDFPVVETLDNFYRFAEPDGYIGRQFDAKGKPVWDPKSTLGFAPPLLSWAELEYAKTAGVNMERLKRAYPSLVKHHRAIARFRRPDGLYYSDSYGCGMDELPRYPRGMKADEILASGVVFSEESVQEHYANKDKLRKTLLSKFRTKLSWNRQAGWIDTSSQVALDCWCLAQMAEMLGLKDEVKAWKDEHQKLAETINKLCWDEQLGFYCDYYEKGTIPRCHAGGFWVLIAHVATPERAARIAEAFQDPNRFGRPIPLPCLPKNDPNYKPEGGYWCGGVWPPTNYVAIRGLIEYGYRDLAESIAKKWYNANARLWVNYGTVFENVSPEQCEKKRKQSQRDFCGWGALAPIALPREFGWLKSGHAK